MHLRFNPSELEEFCGFLKQEFGLSYSSEKYLQLENRIQPILEAFSIHKLCDIIIKSKKDIRLRTDLINALTTNETWFFRHPSHFRILTSHIMPALNDRREKTGDNRLKIWSAGCSIGAETFSILFSLLENSEIEKWNLTLIGSDISSDAIKRARSGIFFQHELKTVGKHILNKYFVPSLQNSYQVKEEYRKMIEFEVLNLLEPWPARKFDIIFCRNVLIYFSEEHKRRITEKFLRVLNENGFYLTSANESIYWQTKVDLKKFFIENEYLYQKITKNENYQLYTFKTPSDLLRALNLLNRVGLDYGLKKIKQSHSMAPKRGIFISQKDSRRANELFSLNSIKVTGSQPLKK